VLIVAEYERCPICHAIINLEIDVHRDEENLYCNNCNSVISTKDESEER
jgi:uncharacterized protein YbaR (Trm112 family)